MRNTKQQRKAYSFDLHTRWTNEVVLADILFFIYSTAKMVAKKAAPTFYPVFSLNPAVAAVRTGVRPHLQKTPVLNPAVAAVRTGVFCKCGLCN